MKFLQITVLSLLLLSARIADGQAVSVSQGPYLQMGSQTAVNVRWRTNIASPSRLRVGTSVGVYPIVISDAAIITEHELRVTGLGPDTKYFYQVGTDTSVIQGDANNFFVTAPPDGSTRRVTIAAFGDCGRNDLGFQTGSLTAYQNYLATQGRSAADLMLLIGDNAYETGTDAEFTSNFFSRYSPNILKNHMLFPCPGNHDYANDATRQADHNVPYYSLFTLPAAGECGGVPSGTGAYYSYDWGNIHFLSLDSYGEEDAGTTRLYDTTGAQVTWVKADLAANTKKWTIAYWHHPPYSMGAHNSDVDAELINIRQNFIGILERNGVDLIICGHSHDYERSYLLRGYYGMEASFNKAAHTTDSSSAQYNGSTNSCPYMTPSGKIDHGTVYVVSGSSGAAGPVQAGYPHNALPFAVNDGGMFYLDINDNRLDAKFLRQDNTITDQFTILKDVKVRDTIAITSGTPVNLTATWPGAYAWNTGATTRSITISPTADTLVTVRDSLTNTCITDQHYIDVSNPCTTPVFTACPPNISNGCSAVVAYAATATGAPDPTISYALTGATAGGGGGTGTGTTFNPGVTNVTITAANACGAASCSFTVTVNTLPNAVTVTGGGIACNNTTIIASNGSDGTIYFQGTTSGGTSTTIPSASQLITSSGTYYFRAQSAAGCWGTEGSATVVINLPPAPPASIAGTTNVCPVMTTTLSDATPGGAWSSSATSIAAVGTGGVVSGVSAGTATIKYAVTNTCGSAGSTAVVTVNALPATPASITGTKTVCAGMTTTLSDMTAGGAWSSSATSIAAVSTGGVVTGVSAGTATIKYAVTNTCGSAGSTAVVTINALPATPASITGTKTVCAGMTTTLSDMTAGGAWSSSATSIAAVSTGGVVTGVSAGTATIKYAVTNTCGSANSTAVVTVSALPATPASITGTKTVCAGMTTTLSDATPGGAWSSSATSMAAVSTGGVVTGVSAGTATIKYAVTNTCGSAGSTAVVTVNALPATPASITGTKTVCVGATTTLSDATSGGTWSSSNMPVATVSTTGAVRGVASGTSTISYAVANSCGSARATGIVTVNATPSTPASITGTKTVCAGATTTLSDLTSGGVWSSSNTSKATINATGVVRGVASATSTISYTVTNGCGSSRAMAVVTVNPLPAAISGSGSIVGTGTTTLSDAVAGGTWSSSNTTKATVGLTSGIVRGVHSGTATITYTLPCGIATKNVTVTGARQADTNGVTGIMISSSTETDISVVPNPNKGLFTISGTLGITENEEVTIKVTNMLGQVVYLNSVKTKSAELNEKIQLSNPVANGMYLLSIASKTVNRVFQIVVNK